MIGRLLFTASSFDGLFAYQPTRWLLGYRLTPRAHQECQLIRQLTHRCTRLFIFKISLFGGPSWFDVLFAYQPTRSRSPLFSCVSPHSMTLHDHKGPGVGVGAGTAKPAHLAVDLDHRLIYPVVHLDYQHSSPFAYQRDASRRMAQQAQCHTTSKATRQEKGAQKTDISTAKVIAPITRNRRATPPSYDSAVTIPAGNPC